MADATKTLEVVISAKDEASKIIGESVGKSQGHIGKLKDFAVGAFKAVSVATIAAGAAFTAFATKAAFAAARIEELEFALHAIAKANNIEKEAADKAVESLRTQNIAHKEALEITSLFIQNQLDLNDALKLANAAKDLAVIGAMDSSQATRTLSEAISSQEPMLLRQFGIVKNLPQIYEEYANSLDDASSKTVINTKKTAANEAKLAKMKKQLDVATQRMREFTDKTKESTRMTAQNRVDELVASIGALEGNTKAYTTASKKAGDELTEAQKKQAFLNAILEGGAKVAGTYDAAMGSVSKRFRSLTGRIIPDFIAQVGEAFSPTLTVVIDGITNSIQGMSQWVTENKDQINEWGLKIADTITKVVKFISDFVQFLVDNRESATGIFEDMKNAWQTLIDLFNTYLLPVFELIRNEITQFVTFNMPLFVEAWQKIRTIVEQSMMIIKNVFEAIWPDLVIIFKGAWTAMLGILKIIWGLIQAFITVALAVFTGDWEAALDGLKVAWEDIWTGILIFLKGIWESIKGVFLTGVNSVVGIINGLIDNLNKVNPAGDIKKIPPAHFQHGGIVPGVGNQLVPALLHSGERVVPRTGADVNAGGGFMPTININMTGPISMDSTERVDELAFAVARYIGRENELAGKGLI